MALVAKLEDVEQQLLRATQVVQLHVRLADGLASSQNPPELDQAAEMEILGLINRVERAQHGLQDITTQLLGLAKYCVHHTSLGKEDEGDNEMGDEVKKEIPVEQYETIEGNVLDSPKRLNLQTEGRSSLEKYTAMAKNAVKMVIDPEDAETIEAWRRIVEVNGINANREFLDLLSAGEVKEEVAESFLNATTFAVSVLTSYQAMSQKPSWLMQLVEDLTDVENAAKNSKFAKVLAPLEKCRDNLVAYCSRNDRDTLEDMSNYVILIERHRGVQANQLLPYLLTLLRKFICDCTDYQLRQDVVGEAPRTDSEWVRFNEVGLALANWMQLLWVADVKCSTVDGVLVSSYLRKFETRFPGRLPPTLHENWCQMIGDRVIRINDDDNGKEESIPQKDSQKHLHEGETASDSTPIGESVPQVDYLKSPHSGETRNDPGAAALSNAQVMTHVNDGLDPPKPLEHFVSAAMEGKCEVENAVRNCTSSCTLEKQPEVVIEKWSVVLKSSFEWAHRDFCTRVSKGDMDTQMVTAFCKATKFTMSLITTYDSRHFSRAWIMQTIGTLDTTTKGILMSEYSQALQPLLQIRDEMIQYCDKRFPDIFDGVSECVKNIEQVVSKKADSKQLQIAVRQFGEHFRNICTYKMFRHNIGAPLLWLDESWQKFGDIGLVLSHWLKRTGKTLIEWKKRMSTELLKLDAMFPGKIPKPLLNFYTSDNTSKHFAAATSRIHGIYPPSAKGSVKRARTDAHSVNREPKRAATTRIHTEQSNTSTACDFEAKLQAYLRMGKIVALISSNCESANSNCAKKIQRFLIQAREFNAQMLVRLRQGTIQLDIAKTFGVATENLADVIWRSPIECITFPVVKELLDQCTEIFQASTIVGSRVLAASCDRLQKYWHVCYADVVQTIRNYVAETNTVLNNMDSSQIGIRVRQLVFFYRNACEVCYCEINSIVSFSRKHELQQEMTEIGAGLNDWIEHVLAHKIQLQKLVNNNELLMKITRLGDALPGSVPPSLIKNLRQAFGIPEPRTLRPRQCASKLNKT